jgi:mRNA interferase RelE/StbE
VYKIELKPSAVRDLRRLPHSTQKRIAQKIDALPNNPFPHGSKKLEATGNFWRIRVGDYRVIYQVYKEKLMIYVVRIKHRGDVYRP